MAFCANCGTQLVEGAKFCASCGTKTGAPVSDDTYDEDDVEEYEEEDEDEEAAPKKKSNRNGPITKEGWNEIVSCVNTAVPLKFFGNNDALKMQVRENIHQALAEGDRSVHSLVKKSVVGVEGPQAAKIMSSLEYWLSESEVLDLDP